jgi:hypothetical protein
MDCNRFCIKAVEEDDDKVPWPPVPPLFPSPPPPFPSERCCKSNSGLAAAERNGSKKSAPEADEVDAGLGTRELQQLSNGSKPKSTDPVCV